MPLIYYRLHTTACKSFQLESKMHEKQIHDKEAIFAVVRHEGDTFVVLLWDKSGKAIAAG